MSASNAAAYPGGVTIEERELTFTSAAPLRAWRLFRVSSCDDGFLLSSPMYHDPDPTYWPYVASTAVCCEDHPAPTPGCRCGIYAVIPGLLDPLPVTLSIPPTKVTPGLTPRSPVVAVCSSTSVGSAPNTPRS